MPYPTPARGQVWQSRDDAYEPGRQVRVDAVNGNRCDVTTTASPVRPARVGHTANFLITNLQRRWRLIAATPVPSNHRETPMKTTVQEDFPEGATSTSLPAGRADTRLLKNLRPGQIVFPDWEGTTEAGKATEWAIVVGHPLGMQLERIGTRKRRWEWSVPVRYPHETKHFRLDGDGTEVIRVLILSRADAELLLAKPKEDEATS